MSNSYYELKDQLKKGIWIFTCSDKPLQFSHVEYRDPNNYGIKNKWDSLSEKEQQDFMYDDFETLEGSYHSFANCSCKIISEQYALWFIKNKCWEFLPETDELTEQSWIDYENKIKSLCEKDNIKYEGY
jgi:hypothetical protein